MLELSCMATALSVDSDQVTHTALRASYSLLQWFLHTKSSVPSFPPIQFRHVMRLMESSDQSHFNLLPNTVHPRKSAIGDTVGAWDPFGCSAEVPYFLDDAAIVTAIKLHNRSWRINFMPAYMLDGRDDSLTHDDSKFQPPAKMELRSCDH